MSQADFLKYVVPNGFMPNEKLLECSIQIMKSVVENPGKSIINPSDTVNKNLGSKKTWIVKLNQKLLKISRFLRLRLCTKNIFVTHLSWFLRTAMQWAFESSLRYSVNP